MPGVTAEQYVGTHGTIFYDEVLGTLRISDGVTPYGQALTLVSSDFQFQFGDFVATTPANGSATLQSANPNQDIDIVSTDEGIINVFGSFHVHTTASYDSVNPDANGAIFRVDQQGYVRILAPDAVNPNAAVTIVGSTTGEYISPVNPGVMLHLTGVLTSPGTPSRFYNDAQNSYAAIVARRFNGTVAAPTAVSDGEEILRISGTAHNGTTLPGTGNQRILYKALGNQTLTNQGGTMEFWTTPQNTVTLTKVASVDNVNGITSTKFTGPLTGNVTGKADTAGNADTVTNGVVTTGSYANPSWITSLAASKVGLGSVENTALSTWAGSSNITTVGTLTNLSVTNTITGSVSGTAGIATTVTLVATNSTAATHYLTFVDSATGNENVRTDTDLTYNPSTNTLFVPRLQSKLYRYSRDAGTIAAGGTLTIDFSTDDVVYCVWGDGMTIAYQNYTAGSVVRLMARKATGTGVDTINLDGVTAAQVSTGSTTTGNVSADTTVFIEFTCINTTIGSVYVKL